MEKVRSILHCDLNNFFASVSLLDKPELRDDFVVVGGDEAARSGIVLAKNEKAKKMGVKTGEALWQARSKCPNLVVLPPDFHLYGKYSRLVRGIYERYTDLVEPFSIDECWLDVTASRLLFGDGEEIAQKISTQVRSELGLTVSIGVSYNKIFAKLGSDMKKPNGITVITPENFQEKVWPLPVSDLLFIGHHTEEKLLHMGITTIGQLALAEPSTLIHTFGKVGGTMHIYANGLDRSAVIPVSQFEEQKSISNSITLPADIHSSEDAKKVLIMIAENISEELRKQGKMAKNVGIIVKNNELHTFEHATQTDTCTQSTSVLADIAYRLFCDYWTWDKPVRMLGIKAYNLYNDTDFNSQLDMTSDVLLDEKKLETDKKIDEIRKKYGSKSVQRASAVGLKVRGFDDKERGPGFPKQK